MVENPPVNLVGSIGHSDSYHLFGQRRYDTREYLFSSRQIVGLAPMDSSDAILTGSVSSMHYQLSPEEPNDLVGHVRLDGQNVLDAGLKHHVGPWERACALLSDDHCPLRERDSFQ